MNRHPVVYRLKGHPNLTGVLQESMGQTTTYLQRYYKKFVDLYDSQVSYVIHNIVTDAGCETVKASQLISEERWLSGIDYKEVTHVEIVIDEGDGAARAGEVVRSSLQGLKVLYITVHVPEYFRGKRNVPLDQFTLPLPSTGPASNPYEAIRSIFHPVDDFILVLENKTWADSGMVHIARTAEWTPERSFAVDLHAKPKLEAE